jgi:sporulation protein YtfJ
MHPIENIMQVTMSEIKEMVDVNTIIGDAIITPDGSTILPISRVSFGFVSGGGEYGKDNATMQGDVRHPFGGGGGSGITITPVGFLVVKGEDVRLLNVSHGNTYEALIEKIPQIIMQTKKMFDQKKQQMQKESGQQ